jgi:hypothetical protein
MMPSNNHATCTKREACGDIAHDYMRPAAAADYVGMSQSTLAKLRMRHNRQHGPVFAKRGGCVVYRRADLDSWMEASLIGIAI